MKVVLIGLVVLFSTWSTTQLYAQPWVKKMQDRTVNFYEVQQAFKTAWGNRPYQRGYGWKQFKRWEDFWEPRVFPHGVRPTDNYMWKEHLKFQRTYPTPHTASRNANWTAMGPFSWTTNSYNPGIGRINAVAEDPNNSNILYVGTPSGGCWKSTDAGGTWTPLTDHLQALGVSAIAIDYTNSDVVYIGTGDDDGGDTYSIGIFKSTDGGSTWAEVTPTSATTFGTRIYRIIIHPTDNNTLFVASSSGCWKSTDAGSTWTLLRSGSWRDMELKPNDPNTIYLSNATFARSINGGTTWSTITTGLPNSSSINRAEIAVSPANPDYVYFLCGKQSNSAFHGLYRSDNSGASFALRANSPNIFSGDQTGSNGNSGQSWYDMALTVSPVDAEELYIGGINVWKSNDGGSSYRLRTHWVYPPLEEYVHADIHVLEFFGNNLYCGSDGGIFKSVDTSGNFADLSAGLNIAQFYRIGGSEQVPHKVVGGTQDNGTNIIENNAAHHIRGADGMEALISPHDSLVIYSSSQYGGFRRSDDGGISSSQIFPTQSGNGAWVTPLAMNPADNDMLLAGFDQVYLSLDKGTSDSPISNFNLNGDLLRNVAIAPSDGYTHFYASTYDEIYATTNSGSSWTNITAGLPNLAITSITVHPTDPLKVWVTFSGVSAGEKVYLTQDGGSNWTNVSNNLPNLPVNCLVYQNGTSNGIYVGTDVGVYYTDDLLAGWQQYMTGLPNVIVRDLEINYTAGKLRAGTYGRGLWESDLRQPISTPPNANFSFSAGQLCPADSVEFTDLSVDHAPSWTWSFPGGTPSTSTLRNPKVYYPNSGIYYATLIVQNPNGSDTITQMVTTTYQPNAMNLALQMDNSAIDISWTLTDDNTGNTIYSTPLFSYNGQDNQLINESVCVDSGCYTLIITDIGNNGLCCGNGNGYYLLTNANGDTLAFGDAFGNKDTTMVCLNQVAPLVLAGASTINATCGNSDGSMTMAATGGDGNYEYSIDGGVTFNNSNTFGNLSAGNYNIVVRDGQGQLGTNTITIAASGQPDAVASASLSTVYLNQGGLVNFFATNSTNVGNYLWTFPDASTSTQASPNFTFTTDGVYPVILTITNGNCTDSDTLSITVVNNVNINQIANNASINILPNPVKDKFSLEIEFLQEQEQIEIIIHNAIGQRVFWQEAQQVKEYKRQIHFGNEPDGVYIVTILSKDLAISKKFVKN